MKKSFILLSVYFFAAVNGFTQTGHFTVDQYIQSRFINSKGREIVKVIVPGKPPENYRAPVSSITKSAVVMSNVPAYSWSFGCSATSASMAAAFYDNHGYPNMYTGPTNGGIMPMNNSSWGSVIINGESRDQCPLSATKLNLDGRTSRGHVDDYWIQYGNNDPDPYITNGWTQHTHGDCTGDYMGTNQSAVGSSDGSTTFYYYPDGSPLYDYSECDPGGRDGCHGLRLFYESRGYTVIQNYTQTIYGLDGNTQGFTFAQYMNEINNGRPVLIQVAGHTMLGFGYDAASSTVYLHDTWDYSDHSMTWGGNYSGMDQWGVTVVELLSANSPPISNFSGTPTSILTGQSVSFSDLSTGNPTHWQWTFQGGVPATSNQQNPIVTYSVPGNYTVTLVASNSNGSAAEVKSNYILVSDPSYCEANGQCDEYIAGVQLGSINNSSGCGTNGYTDYTNLSTNLAIGQSYTLTVVNGNPVYPDDQCGVWVDWNHDFDFNDTGEFLTASGSPGSGPYTITITPPSNALPGSTIMRIRILYSGEILACGASEWGEVEDYTVNITSTQAKTLNLTVFLQGLFNTAAGTMNKANDATGNHFPGTIADRVSIKLAQATSPYTILAQVNNVNLDCNGTCTAQFLSTFNGSYYIIVSHRNSITTWSAVPVSFAGSSISYNFSDSPSKAYGNNQIHLGSKYCMFSGDVNQDGFTDSGDMTFVDNKAANSVSGYLREDINGDGIINASDQLIVGTNSNQFVKMITP